MDNRQNSEEIHLKKGTKKEKIRTYQNGKIVLNNNEFEATLDVFRTLFQWQCDLERGTSPRDLAEKDI